MIQFTTLEDISAERRVACFNAAFADYAVPFTTDVAAHNTMMQRRGYDPALSVGAFLDGELVGFHLIGQGEWQGRPAAYDASTGIMPVARGQGLVGQMFDWVAPRWQAAGIEHCVLEVMTQNQIAQRAYSKAGFVVTREFDCMRLDVLPAVALPPGVVLAQSESNTLPAEVAHWLDNDLAWQNSLASIARTPQRFLQTRLLVEGRPAAVGLQDPKGGDVPLFAVAPQLRQRGLGGSLLASMRGASAVPLRFINLTSDSASVRLIKRLGGTLLVRQFEMGWSLPA